MPVKPPPGSYVQVLTELSSSHVIPVVDLNRPDIHHRQAISPSDLNFPEGPAVEDGYIYAIWPDGAPQTLSGAGDLGAINLTSAQTKIIITGPEPASTATLAAANIPGLNKIIRMATSTNGSPIDITIEGASFSPYRLETNDDLLHLMWGADAWFILDERVE
jgi:hypothetical protein